ARDVDRIVADCAVGVQIAAALRPADDVRERETRCTDVEERKIGAEMSPGRTHCGRGTDPDGLIVVGGRERSIALAAGDGTAEAPVVDEERAHRTRALHVPSASIAQRCVDIREASSSLQSSRNVVCPGLSLVRQGY